MLDFQWSIFERYILLYILGMFYQNIKHSDFERLTLLQGVLITVLLI